MMFASLPHNLVREPLNVKKTKSMLIGNNKLLNQADYIGVRLDMDSIEQVGEVKYIARSR